MAQGYDSETGEFYNESVDQTALVPVTTQLTGPFIGYEAKYGQSVFTMAEKKLAERVDLTPAQQQQMLASYSHSYVELLEGSSNHMNEVMDIIGAMVVYHEPYKPMSGEDIIKPGYFRLVLKTNIKREDDLVVKGPKGKQVITVRKNLLLSISANNLVKYFLTLIESTRWFDFESPLTGYFSGTKTTGYSFSTLSANEALAVQEILGQVE